jgi:hypothetical protein
MNFVLGLITLISGLVLLTFSSKGDVISGPIDSLTSINTETFIFSSNGVPTKGKIYRPPHTKPTKACPLSI